MQGVGEVEPPIKPGEGTGNHRTILDLNAGQADKSTQSVTDRSAVEPVARPQDPFCLEQNGLEKQDRLSIDQRLGLCGLHRIISG